MCSRAATSVARTGSALARTRSRAWSPRSSACTGFIVRSRPRVARVALCATSRLVMWPHPSWLVNAGCGFGWNGLRSVAFRGRWLPYTQLQIQSLAGGRMHHARILGASLASLTLAVIGPGMGSSAMAADDEVTISHYCTGDLGRDAITKIFGTFEQSSGVKVVDSPTGHEDFKAAILVMAAGRNLPDVFSYWAGARTAFVVDSGALQPIDDLYQSAKLDTIIPASIVKGATLYGGKHYLVPFGYHYAGLFYNKKVLAKAGVTEPRTWNDLLAACKKLKAAGVAPIALGSKNRWPAQFWFDYLLLRTAGPDYRARLMAGQAKYTDPEVQRAMKMWKELIDAGYFAKNPNADDWTDAADKVMKGEAGMTLMGTWITGYWDGLKQ